MSIYGIYNRDYSILTKKEEQFLDNIKKNEKSIAIHEVIDYSDYPKAVRHYESLFPNHYLDIFDLKNNQQPQKQLELFHKKLNDTKTTERTLLRFFKESKAYFIISSLMINYGFGHHDAFIFPEFQLGNSHQVDFLLVGKNSGGYHFIFVELEDPYKQITLKDGELGNAFNKGIKQINDWKYWLEQDFQSLSTVFMKCKHPQISSLPTEFFKYESTRMEYIVVAGRRGNFNAKTYRTRRLYLHQNNIALLHYDNLYDYAIKMM
ncbi:Shedu anti-phage system protein SduA domain-containing protein [Bacillus cereus]|uniref:Shedu anti-phage system protein SduA domain-containing protein n=1 Tax=Bacillus cereus TaxID=1396 RepID=UPI000A46B744|nr:Shedu anti-phage system protein SduA domain-containing protein [Bacillus cereus]